MVARVFLEPEGELEAWLSWGVITVLNFTRSSQLTDRPGADLEPVRQRGDEATPLPRHRRAGMEWNHPLGTHVAGQISRAEARQEGCIPRRRKDTSQKGVVLAGCQFPACPPARPPPFLSSSRLQQLLASNLLPFFPVPFVKIVIYSVLNFSLLAWHNKTCNVVPRNQLGKPGGGFRQIGLK